jgi:hypothetical protein
MINGTDKPDHRTSQACLCIQVGQSEGGWVKQRVPGCNKGRVVTGTKG